MLKPIQQMSDAEVVREIKWRFDQKGITFKKGDPEFPKTSLLSAFQKKALGATPEPQYVDAALKGGIKKGNAVVIVAGKPVVGKSKFFSEPQGRAETSRKSGFLRKG